MYVAKRLKKFCEQNAQDLENIELHAVGHSAGAVFLSHFLPVAHALKIPSFTTAHFLAPAVRVDTFKEHLAPLIGDDKAVRKLTVFTMKKDYERDDDCAHIYRKSLLYLIYYALENRRATPILGLEESLRGDGDLKKLFGLDGNPSKEGQVVWSVTQSDTGRLASESQTHGGFDDDAPTMNSVARLILDREDADKIVGYAIARGVAPSSREWTDEVDWPEELNAAALPALAVSPALPGSAAASANAHRPVGTPMPLTPLSGTGRRRALCVGINRYPDPNHELAGCVADARMWADALSQLGFTTSLLLDGQATREAMDRELLALVGSSVLGDVIVFQYAGHGTHVPDLNGDEEDGTDEALCPVDFAAGALYIDDDIAAVFARIPDGVNMTCFMDCCHSGTNSRVAVGAPPTQGARSGKDERKRYVKPTPDIIEAHRRFREKSGGRQRTLGSGGISLMRDVKFSACLDAEVAWESDGHGEFTLRATRILGAGIDGLTNKEFARRVIADFGISTRQHPMLDCATDAHARRLLQPIDQNVPARAASLSGSAMTGCADPAVLAQTLTSIQQLLETLAKK